VALAAVVLAAAPVAMRTAQARADTKPQSARVQIEGSGAVNVRGSLVIFGSLQGPSNITIQDEAGNGRITIGTRPYRLKKGTRRSFTGISGRIYIEGKQLQVQFTSAPRLSLSVAAVGRAQFLAGTGSYQLNNGVAARCRDDQDDHDRRDEHVDDKDDDHRDRTQADDHDDVLLG
jgi:hypothetical protein